MVRPTQSPRARARQSLLTRHGGRSARERNLWLVYSPKTNRDWVLDSDRAVVHWLYFLEADPDIKSFNLAPEPVRIPDLRQPATINAIAQDYSGRPQWHHIATGFPAVDEARLVQFAEAAEAAHPKAVCQWFDEELLSRIADEALNWMGAISFAAAIRHLKCHPVETAVAAVVHQHEQGTVRELLTLLSKHDVPVVTGVLVRLAINGHLSLDLKQRSFGYQTVWSTRHGH